MVDRTYAFRLRGDGKQLREETEALAKSVEKLAGTTEALQRDQAAAAAASDRFLASLQRQAQSIGRTESELLALRAAELGVADAARPLIQQLDAAAAAQERESEAARRAVAAQRALENIRAAAQAEQREQYQAQQSFIDGLQREAEAIGKTRSELLQAQAAKLGVSAQAAPLIQRLQAGERAFGGFARGGKLSAMELQQVAFQLNDLGVQVASGQNPIIALVQQGSQLSGTFGGVGNTFRALTSLVTPAVALFGGLAAVVGTVAFTYAQGYREQANFEKGLLLSGNRAGTTRVEYEALARTIEQSTFLTRGAAREALQAVVASGDFGSQSIGAAAKAAGLLADRTGKAVDQIVQDLGGRLRNGVTQGATELNRQYNFLSAAQLKYIRELEAAGEAEEARRVTLSALAEQIGRKTPTELGLLETALEKGKKAWSAFWDAAFNIGRTATLDDQIKTAIAAVEGAQQRLAAAESKGSRNQPDIDAKRRRLQAAEEFLAGLREQQRFEGQAAQQRAAATAENEREIRDMQKDSVDARLAVIRAAYAQNEAYGDVARARELAAVQRQFDQLEISQEQYVRRRYALERAAIAAKVQSVEQEIALERQRVVENPNEALQQQAKVLELQARKVAIQRESVELDERLRRGDLAGAPRAQQESPQAAFRQAELEQQQALEQGLAQRRVAALESANELRLVNRQLNVALIRDDQQRGQAQIALEAEELRKRLDLAALTAEDRKAVEDDVARYIGLRQAQLTEELKPEYQRMLEAWRDVNRLMRETSDQFQTDFLRTGEDMWVRFASTGKVTLRDIGNLAVETLARFNFREQIAPLWAQAGNFLARTFGFGGGTAGGGVAAAGQSAVQTAQTTAITANTTAQTAQTAAITSATGGVTAMAQAAYEASIALARIAAGAAADEGSSFLGKLIGVFAGSGSGSSGATVGDTGSSDLFGAFTTYAAKGLAFDDGQVVRRFAKGGAFSGGRLTNGPETFYFREGGTVKRGVRGEAETEGIFPLVRTASGDLGIRAQGAGEAQPAGNTYINITNNSGQPVRTQERTDGLDRIVDMVVGEVDRRIASMGSTGQAIQGRFGASPAGGISMR